ncbi:MAG: two-component regulator propeller domain-containing protein, partial [Limisphaerales bacterium]
MATLHKCGQGTAALIRCAWLFSVLLLFSIHLQAADNNPEFLQRVWQLEDGIPNPVVRKIHQTRNGYLWLGTDEGLARFDGIRFTEFNRKDFKLSNDRWMVGISEAKDGSIWAS